VSCREVPALCNALYHIDCHMEHHMPHPIAGHGANPTARPGRVLPEAIPPR
jgi:hypothetical protein